MIAALVLGCVVALDVAEFFPTKAGTEWKYEMLSTGSRVVSTTKAGAPVTIGDEQAIPFKTTVGGTLVETIHYRLSTDTVYVVAYKAVEVFDEPRPILRVAEGGAKWDVDTSEDGLPLSLKNESTMRGRRKVLEQEVDVLELKVVAVLGEKATLSTEYKQTAIYGRGIGLVELTEERKVNKKVYKRTVKLTKYTAPSEGGM